MVRGGLGGIALIGRALGALLFFLMLFVPTTYQPVKAVLLASILLLVILRALRARRLDVDPSVLLITIGMACLGVIWIALGVARGAPGALRMGTVFVIWPLVYTALAGGADRPFLRLTHRLFIIAAIAIGAYAISYILHEARWLPDAYYLDLDTGPSIGFYEGYIEFTIHSIGTVLFLVPYLIALLLTLPDDAEAPVRRRWAWVALVFGLAVVLLSGRRGLLLVVALAPVVTAGMRAAVSPGSPWLRRVPIARFAIGATIVVIAIGAYLESLYGFDPRRLLDQFLGGFNFLTGEESATVRGTQYQALIQGWHEYPWFGSGHGAPAPGSLRSVEQPWAYELSYLALLYHTGLIGILLYGAAVTWLYVNALRAVRSGDTEMRPLLPIMVGTTCFLVANATNPYLEKYDFLWVLFLPMMYVNRWRLSRSGSA